MKKRLVLWGENEKNEKLLIAVKLLDQENKVDIYTFPLKVATEEFSKTMMNDWRNNKEVEFPEGFAQIERPLNIADTLLPDHLKVDRTDVVNRAQTEWNFIVMSAKMQQAFTQELEELKDRVNHLEGFDKGIWEELKSFWNKVQKQIHEKNLFRSHANQLRKETNALFDEMKEKRKAWESKLKEKSTEIKSEFMSRLGEIEQKVEKGLGLKPLFEQLKDLQKDFKKKRFTRQDRDEVWNKIDGLFKVIKEKRFGEKSSGASPLKRIQNRYEGLLHAIQKMEKSIDRDKNDLAFEKKRIDTTDGQLEQQIRQAKLVMIEERINSKTSKLEDMLKTKKQLEQKIEREIQKEKQREIDAEKKKAQKALEAEKKEQAKAQIEQLSDQEKEKLAQAAQSIKQDKGNTAKKNASKDPDEVTMTIVAASKLTEEE